MSSQDENDSSGSSVVSRHCPSCDGCQCDPQIWINQIPKEQLTKEICEIAVSSNIEALSVIPSEFVNEDLIKKALEEASDKKSIYKIFHLIPDRLKTRKIYRLVARYKPKLLKTMPEEYLDELFLRNILRKNPRTIEYIPAKFLTDHDYWEAIKSGVSLARIPREKRSKEICLKAIKTNPANMEFVPKEFIDEALFHNLVENCDNWYPAIPFIPNIDSYMTPDMSIECVKSGGLKLLPMALRTLDLCYEHLRSTASASGFYEHWLDGVPKEFLTTDFLVEALRHNGRYLAYIPVEQRTEEMYRAAVSSCGAMIKEVPEVFLTPELCLEAFRTKFRPSLEDIPVHFRCKEICLEAAKYAIYLNPEHIPSEIKTPQFNWELISQGGSLDLIPKDQRTREMFVSHCLRKINEYRHDNPFDGVPRKYFDESFLAEVLQRKPEVFRFIDEDDLTLKLCQLALQGEFYQAQQNLKYIPKRFKCEELYMTFIDNFDICFKPLACIPENQITLQMCRKALEKCNRFSVEYVEAFIPQRFQEQLKDLIAEKHRCWASIFSMAEQSPSMPSAPR